MKKRWVINIVFIVIIISSLLIVYELGNISGRVVSSSYSKKVLLIVYNPIIETSGNQRLINLKGWNDPNQLAQSFISDIKEVSDNSLNYEIFQKIEVDDIPQKKDGFKYTDATYLQCLNDPDHSDCHSPDEVNYKLILDTYNVCEKLNSGLIDEVWFFGGPWFGYYESILAGPSAFWYNSDPLTETNCNKLLPIMGFNYERGVGEMLESFGHRAEATLTYVFGGWDVTQSRNDWDRYGQNKGQTQNVNYYQCGSVHYGPNSLTDYDWSNQVSVLSNCDDWYNYPNFQGTKKQISCQEWGCDIRGHHKWWLKHLPKASGVKNGILNNWWAYVSDPNLVYDTWIITGQCNDIYYKSLWESVFKINYVSNTIVEGFKSGSPPSGNCIDFDLYNDSKIAGSHLIFFINHNSTRKPEYVAGIINVNDPNGDWVIDNTYQFRDRFYTTLFGVKNRISEITGLAGAITEVNSFFKQSVADSSRWDSSANDYYLYREFETTKQGSSYLTKNVSIAVYKQKGATIYYYGSEIITPSLIFVINIPNINNVEDNSSGNAFDLDDYFISNVPINYVIYPSDVVNMTVNEQKKVNLSFKKDWFGITNVSIYGFYNDIFLNSSNNFTVNISPTNDRPVLKEDYPIQISLKKNNDETINFDDFFYDPDGDVLTYTATGNSKMDVEIDDEENEAKLTPDFDFIGIETVKFKATDPGGLSVETGNIKLNVTASGTSGGTSATTLPIGGLQIMSKSPVSSIVNVNPGGSEVFLVDAVGSNSLTYSWMVNGINQNNPTQSFAFTSGSSGSYTIKVDVSDGIQTTSASWTAIVSQNTGETSSTTLSGAGGSVYTNVGPGSGGIDTSNMPTVGKPNFLWIYIGVGVLILVMIGVVIFFIIRTIKKKPKEPGYELIKSNEELGIERDKELGVGKTMNIGFNKLYPIINFIRDYRTKGFSDETIRNALLKKGWSNEDINEAIKDA